MSDKSKTEKGTLIRGADGGLYFVPDDQMKAFRLPDEKTTEARELLDQNQFQAQGPRRPAVQGEDFAEIPEGAGYIAIRVNKLAALIRRRPRK